MESMGDFMTKRAQRQYSREKGMSQITEESFLEVCKASGTPTLQAILFSKGNCGDSQSAGSW